LSGLLSSTSPPSISLSSIENTLNGFVNDMYFYNNTVFLATQDNNGEVYIYGEIPGFAGYNTQFATNGTYTQFPPTDAGHSVNWNAISWGVDTSTCAAADAPYAVIKMQVRSAADSTTLSNLQFVGP